MTTSDRLTAALLNLVAVHLRHADAQTVARATGLSGTTVRRYGAGTVTYPRAQTLLTLLAYSGYTLHAEPHRTRAARGAIGAHARPLGGNPRAQLHPLQPPHKRATV